jgi:hypothetical protein
MNPWIGPGAEVCDLDDGDWFLADYESSTIMITAYCAIGIETNCLLHRD